MASFDGGHIASDGAALLLRAVEQRTGILRRCAAGFRNHRRPERIEHTVAELVQQRVYALALGCEDLSVRDRLREDPLLALVAGKQDLTGQQRRRAQDRGKAGANPGWLQRARAL